MTDQIYIQLTLFLSLLVLDMLTVAARPGVGSNSFLRTYGQGESKDPLQAHSIPLFNSPIYARASLFVAQGVLRFALAGTALLMAEPWLEGSSTGLWWSAAALAVAALFVTWMEWVVEDRAKHHSAWSPRLAGLTRLWMILFFPLLAPTVKRSPKYNGPDPDAVMVLENEVKSLVDAGQQEGVFEQDERKMIYSIFRLGDTLAREIMVPRIDITAMDVETSLGEAVDSLLKSGYSRVPVYQETVDNILGVLYTKDLLGVWRKGVQVLLSELLRPAYFVPEAKKVDELLAEMQNQRVHMALVVDEYGGIAGLVTLEDIVEEIVGEIQDEFDQAEESPYQEIQEGEYVFLGRVDLDDFNDLLECNLPREEADTLGGYIYKQIGRVPAVGEIVQENNLLLTVEQVSGRRIRKIRAQKLPLAVEKEEEKSDAESG